MKKLLLLLGALTLIGCSSKEPVEPVVDTTVDSVMDDVVAKAQELNLGNGVTIVTNENGVATLVMSNAVTYAFDSADLSYEAEEILATLAGGVNKLNAMGASKNMFVGTQIVGHTDSVGSDAYNQNLSERRAVEAAQYLVSEGVDSNLIAVAGAGESTPVATNDTAEGRQMNRRIEITLVPVNGN